MNELAGGFYKGDRVVCNGRPGIVFGKPARAALNRISVAVMYDHGQMLDERVVNLQLFGDEPEPAQAESPRQPDLPVYCQEPLEPAPHAAPGRPVVPRIAGMGRREEPEMDKRMSQGYGMPPQQGYGMPQDPYDMPPEYDVQDRHFGRPMQGGLPLEEPSFEEDESPDAVPEEDSRTQTRLPQQRSLFDQPPAEEVRHEEEVDEMVDIVLDKIRRNYTNLRMAFRALDRSNNGYVSRADFFDAMEHVMLSAGHSPEEVDEVAERFQLGRGEVLSFDEFVHVVGASEENPYHHGSQNLEDNEEHVVKEDRSDRERVEKVDMAIQAFKQTIDRRYDSMRAAFRALDKSRKSSLSPSEFAMGLSMHGVNLSPNELQDAWDMFDLNQTGQISYADFCRVMSQRPQFGKHLGRQMFK